VLTNVVGGRSLRQIRHGQRTVVHRRAHSAQTTHDSAGGQQVDNLIGVLLLQQRATSLQRRFRQRLGNFLVTELVLGERRGTNGVALAGGQRPADTRGLQTLVVRNGLLPLLLTGTQK